MSSFFCVFLVAGLVCSPCLNFCDGEGMEFFDVLDCVGFLSLCLVAFTLPAHHAPWIPMACASASSCCRVWGPGFPRDYAISCLQNNKHNSVTTTQRVSEFSETGRGLQSQTDSLTDPSATIQVLLWIKLLLINRFKCYYLIHIWLYLFLLLLKTLSIGLTECRFKTDWILLVLFRV